MTFVPPPDADIVRAFPELSSIARIDIGGFKAVYKTTVGGKDEVFKLLSLPASGNTEEQKAYRREAMGRAEREVSLLGRCRSRELEKLGSLPPRVVTIS